MKYDCYTKKTIDHCGQCRFYRFFDGKGVCAHSKDDFSSQARYASPLGIPLWCPLPEAPDENMREAA